MQMHLSGRPIDEVALDVLRNPLPGFRQDGVPYFVAYSGGKDSCVILDLAKRSGVPFEAHYHYTPLDPPELRAFIREQIKIPANHLTIDPPERSLKSMGREKQFMPRAGARWCCQLFKEKRSPPGVTTILGVRWAEGNKRASRSTFERRRSGGGKVINPIVGWETVDVWQYIRERGLSYCALYDEGWPRLGCVLCPLARNPTPLAQEKARRQMARWPQITRIWRMVSREIWTTGGKGARRFSSEEAMWQSWLLAARSREAKDDGECGLFGPPVELADDLGETRTLAASMPAASSTA